MQLCLWHCFQFFEVSEVESVKLSSTNESKIVKVVTLNEDLLDRKIFAHLGEFTEKRSYPADEKYGETTPSNEGDLIQAIEHCVKVMKDKDSSREDKVFYLKMSYYLYKQNFVYVM